MDFENNEIMEVNEAEVDVVETETEERGIGTGAAMLIGAGLTLATTAAVKLVKKGIAAWKQKKALKKPAEGQKIEPNDEAALQGTLSIQDPEEDPEE